MSNKTHWKKLTNPNYLGSWDFEEKEERTLLIEKVEKDKVKDPTGAENEVVVMHLKDSKPFILNKTNLRAVEKSTGSSYIEDWVGKQITFYVANVKAFGSHVDALRIKPVAPKEKAKPKLDSDRFENAFAAVELGTYTKDDLIKKYDLTEEQLNRLNSIVYG